MKKILAFIMAALCAATVFTACAGGNGGSSDEAALAKYAELIESQVEGTFDASILTVDAVASGNTLIFKYTYMQDLPDLESVTISLEESLDAMEETGSEYVQQMSVEAGTEIEAVVFEYYSKDGELIVSREFK